MEVLFLLHVQDFERSICRIGESADLFRARLVKRTVGTGLLISPDEWNAVCKRRYRIKWLRLKLPDFLLSCGDHGKGRCLDTSAGKLRVVFAGEGTGRVDADNPVGFGARHGGTVQIVVVFSRF